jgi:hypothetical protein
MSSRLRGGLVAFVAAVVALVALVVSPGAAQAQTKATVMLLHGIPGAVVDVVVDGQVVVPGFKPGQMQDLSAFAGQTLRNVEVRAAGTTTVVIGPIPTLAVPASGNATVVAHLDAAGTPKLTPFVNDTTMLPAGQGRLTVRHTAAAPAVDVVLGATRPFTNLANGAQASAALPAGPIAGAKIAPTGGAPIADVPTVELKAGTNLIVYAVGSLSGNTFTFYTQTVSGLGGMPTIVNTGGEGPGLPTAATVSVLGALGLATAAGALIIRRRPA